ncbi:hypothetical protein [uncultured Pseudacidovorax sp.]|uniref:hypothetical protein n=1 Tax=uncultured Pseudacidovorax sp. TaxID=679313 RepID=UPI0025F8C961|nr:hypothetical protein [uncultured Pseudacidovorax sp.]
MHLGKLIGSASPLRVSSALARGRTAGLATLVLAFSTAAFAQGQAGDPPQVPAAELTGIPLFTADPRPSPMGPAKVARSTRTSPTASEARSALAEGGHSESMRSPPTPGAGMDMAAAR